MKTSLPASHNNSVKTALIVKLLILLSIILLCFGAGLYADANPVIKPGIKNTGRFDKSTNISNKPKNTAAFAAPTLTYSGGPQAYLVNNAIPTLTPTSSGVAAIAYATPADIGSGLAGPRGLAIDAAGNVYMADFLNGKVKKIPVGGGAPVNWGSGFSQPIGVAVDAAGNVYVADYNSTVIKKIPAGGGAPVVIGTGFTSPVAITADPAGNVYVADQNVLWNIPAGGAPVIFKSGFTNLISITLDAAGNVYAGDSADARIYKLPSNGVASIFASDVTAPIGLALDGEGNMFFSDGVNNILNEIPADGSATKLIGTFTGSITSAALGADGTLYVSDYTNNAVKKITPLGGYHLSQGLPSGLKFNGATGVISGTPVASSPAANYTVTAYNSAGKASATINLKVSALNISYNGPLTFTTATPIAPVAPVSNGVDAAAYSASSTNIGSGFESRGIAMDAAGNIYIADYNANLVRKIPANGGPMVSIGSGFSGPIAVAVDVAGNVYVADYNHNSIKKIPFGGGAVTTIGSGFSQPRGVAVDVAGNVYVADYNNHAIKKIAAVGGAVTSLGTFTSPLCVVVDANSNVYFTESSNGVIYKILATGGPAFIVASGLSTATGLTVDASGNIFIADLTSTNVMELSATTNNLTPVGPALSAPAGIIIDPAGNLYVSERNGAAIKKIVPIGGYYVNFLPAGLNFDNSTGIISGTPISASAALQYSVTAYNSFGSNSATFSIQINQLPLPVFSYTAPVKPYAVNHTITPLVPQSTGVTAPGYAAGAYVLRAGFTNPIGIAVTPDGGRILIAEAGNNALREVSPASNNTFTQATGLNYPSAVALDAAGNMYVANQLNNVITRVAYLGGAKTTVGSGFKGPTGVAVDAAGNIYVADKGNNLVKRIPAGGGATVVIGSGFNQPTGVAVDNKGNVYVADAGNNAIKMIPAAGGSPVTLGSGFSQPVAVAIDASGYIYVADTGNNLIAKMQPGGGVSTIISNVVTHPLGIAVDGSGVVYVTDNINGSIKEVIPSGGYYVTPALPQGLTIDNTTGIISGTPTAAQPAMYNKITAFNSTGPVSYNLLLQVDLFPQPTVFYNTPQSFTLNTAISPVTPVSTDVSAMAYAAGAVNIGNGFTLPNGVAVDGVGNVYVADTGNGAVKEIRKSDGATVGIGSGFNNPAGVAVDAKGNVFVADNGNNKIYKIPVDGGATIAIGSGFVSPTSLAVDSAGNVFVTDNGSNSVKKIPANGGATTTIASGFNSVTGIAVDVQGNVYACDPGNNIVKKIPADGSSAFAVGSGFNQPIGVTVDAAGNIFVSDFNNNAVKMVPANGGAIVTIGSGFNHPYGVAADGSGNLYVSDYLNNLVKKVVPTGGYFIAPSLPAGLNFDNNTGVISGTPKAVSAAANYTVTGYNVSASNSATLNIKVNLTPPPTVSYSGPQTYNTNVAIAPLTPTASGVAAPGISNTPFTIVNVGQPVSVATDATGNVYFADHLDNTIKKIPVNSNVPVIIASGFTQVIGVAVDAAGNVYAGDYNTSTLTKIPAGGGAPVAFGSGFTYPSGITFDAAGNMFVADQGQNGVFKLPAGGSTFIKLPIFLQSASSVAVDASGNLFVACSSTNTVKKIPADGSPVVSIGTGFNLPFGVAVDNFGNIFVADNSTVIKMITANGGAQVSIGSGFVYPTGVTIDVSGNLYIADLKGHTISKISRTGGYYINPSLPAGLTINETTGVISGTPKPPTPATNYTVTAFNASGGGSATLNIKTVTIVPTLSALSLNSGAFSPAFATAITTYTQSVPNATSTVKVTPTLTAAGAKITVNGILVASGVASAAIPLAAGPNVITILLTAPDGVTTKSYAVTITRAGSTNASLADLSLSSGTLSPAYSTGVVNYTASVTNATSTITVTPTAGNPGATIKVNGAAVASGTASAVVHLVIGVNTVTTVVTAQDGTTIKTYKVVVSRAGSTNASLSALTLSSGALSPAFAVGTVAYTASVSNATSFITITPTTGNPTATVKINGVAVTSGSSSAAIPLVYGPNVINTVVMAQDGITIKTYKVTVTRAGSNNAGLASLKLSAGTLAPAFNTATLNYTTDEANATSSIKITPIASDAGAVIKINGTTVASGSASANVPIAVGPNVIDIALTAQDGVTAKTYSVTVTRSPSTNASLSALNLSVGTLSPVFSAGAVTYNVSESNATTSITVTPTAGNPAATIKVNGATVTSGSASGNVPLAIGANTVSIAVTAQDGTTVKTYKLNITRATGPLSLAQSVENTDSLKTINDGIVVHAALSPNGDGVNDVLTIDGITNYPDNKLMIMNAAGTEIYRQQGYDNAGKVFDGHSKTGALQKPGTYFYQLEYTGNGKLKYKTGYIILKY